MSISLCTVTGNIFRPDGKIPVNARVRFTLKSWGEESNSFVPPDAVEADVDSAGAFTADVWRGATVEVAILSDVQGITRKTVLSKAAVIPAASSTTLSAIV